jgi:cation diffusion facilitator family transporter
LRRPGAPAGGLHAARDARAWPSYMMAYQAGTHPSVQTATRIAAFSIAVGLAVLALKGAAWWLTGSAALYSDALETVVNVAASAIALYALHIAGRPADREHPYGHAKAEFLAAALEGGLILAAAASILAGAWHAWLAPRRLDMPLVGLALNGVATVINFVWAGVLLRTSRNVRSPALAADARHLMSDVASSTGVAVGVGLVIWTGLLWLDSVVAALTAVYVLYSGVSLIGGSVSGLMDEAPDQATIDQIRAVISANAEGAIEAHDLRTRAAGRQSFLEFHLVVPGTMPVAEAHEICDRIEAAFHTEMAHLIVNIHVEPEHKAKHHGVVVV